MNDPILAGLARGWRVYGQGHQPLPGRFDCDVAIVGSGAGGGITAEVLARAGLDVVLIEEGPLRSSSSFRQLESDAYPALYQESAARKTLDKSITILQGRCVGGSTTVNWTSSFRTPPETLEYWKGHFELHDYDPSDLLSWFDGVERRLGIAPWSMPPNRNNELLRRGASRLGIGVDSIPRNVRGCWNLGSCGLGCPTNAKQSMLVTAVPAALDNGARLLVQTRADRFELEGSRVRALVCETVSLDGSVTGGTPIRVRARHYVASGGAINTPALLLRSAFPDPNALLGRRTFLHPVVLSAAQFNEPVEGWRGAPQTLYSDHFLHTQPIDGPMGFKLETPPLHPVIFATTLAGYGREQAALLTRFPDTQVLLALLRDGFHSQSPGGRVTIERDGIPRLAYPLNSFVMDGARRALLAMAEVQFAAGAGAVLPVHEQTQLLYSRSQARQAIAALDLRPLLLRVVSAHVMGGCALGGSERLGSVQPDGVHWQVRNLSVHDGSLFPTSIGANPQLSIYGIVHRLAVQLATRLGGTPVMLG